MSYLISKNIIKQTHGSFGDNLVVIGKFSSKSRKQRYITDPYYNYLLRLKQNDKNKQTIDDVKDNQRYMFSSGMDSGMDSGNSNSGISNSECVS